MLTIQASSIPLIPLSANYMHDNIISFNSYLQQWDDGNITFSSSIFTNTRDVKANNDTLLYMTSAYNIDTIVSDVGVTIPSSVNNGYISLISNNGNYVTVNGNTLAATASSVGTTETFGLIKNSDETVSFIYNNIYLTVDPSNHWNVTLTNDATLLSYGYHKYKIIAQGIYYVIQSVDIGTGSNGQTPPLFNRYINSSFGIGPLRATGTTRSDNSLFLITNITAGGGVVTKQEYTGFSPNTWWVKYYNTINNHKYYNNTMNIDIDNSLSGVKQNYLVNLPYKTKISTGKYNSNVVIGSLDIDFNNLKTIKTPECECTVKQGKTGSDCVELRQYDKIFSGTNQDYGYENPYMGYTSDTKEITLKKDSITYFHYPRSAERMSLSAAGIIEDGAVAGNCPFKADKIWKKNADYKKNVWWGDSLQWQQGTWLCSWLSGSLYEDTIPVWKDRWYNPGFISSSGALVSTPVSGVIIDEDSSMTFDPGVWYKFAHIGEYNNNTIVSTLTCDGTKLKLHYDNWDSNIIDLSPYSNNGSIENYTDESVVNDKIQFSQNSVLSLNGVNQYCNVPYNSSYDVNDNLTYSCWAYTDDWDTVCGNHILSNNFRGGWSLAWTNGFVNTIIPILETTYGHVLFINIDNNIIIDKLLPPFDYNPETPPYAYPTAILVDDNLYTWVIDNEYKNLYKMDYNGDITKSVEFLSSIDLTDMTIDSNNNIYVLVSGAISGYNSDGIALTSINIDPSTSVIINSIDVNSQDYVRGFEETEVCYDNMDISWTLSGGDVYSNGDLVISGVNATNIACNKDDSIWILNNTTDFMKIVGTTISLSGTVTTNNNISSRGINFTNEFDGTNYVDYVWITQSSDNTLYKYNMDGIQVSYLNIADKINNTKYYNQNKNNMNFIVNGDFTGYDRSRKFHYNKYNGVPQIQSKITTRNGNNLTTSLMTVSSTLISKGWHHFVTTYDGISGLSNMYVDTLLVNSISTVPESTIYYRYDNSFTIGTKSGIYSNISDELLVDDYYFKGKIDDVRIYDLTVTQEDIKNIYMTRLDFYDIIWNMPTGKQNYVEEIERFFKHKLPGMKSQYFNIRISNLGISNTETRSIIEEIIRDTVTKISPAHTELYNIIWD